ncbi:MAG: hypothetical protein COS36_04320 [Candidatus Altarchaeum sp. CG03_land_8_20_14_0_80_32_618]|nr:MAG: hypothetical protein AUK59_00680 [Candidatus Altarchaeum sp. CG2_30_32_3053]PIV27847.1 MAG: hypothetical protein COS36_04320 [Candidatus Altarchaeum sp. CG03_land_8_20_14_0_80_32_618]PIX48344.1 MAG: hypothetical protein COZ53_04260 [Candidatus Altarchaeum sp. CG_4_8_14_3_um_filter_33_2054]PJC13724.1 MAG: hypothetical protein CO063_03785 [Candidatus Altarchaeum sp. CG_4_9_14_0_8_um_filter_32_206]
MRVKRTYTRKFDNYAKSWQIYYIYLFFINIFINTIKEYAHDFFLYIVAIDDFKKQNLFVYIIMVWSWNIEWHDHTQTKFFLIFQPFSAPYILL